MTARKFEFSGYPTESDLHRLLRHIRRIDTERDLISDVLHSIGEIPTAVNVEVHTGSAEGILWDIVIATHNELPLAADRREVNKVQATGAQADSNQKIREVLERELGPLTHQQRVGIN